MADMLAEIDCFRKWAEGRPPENRTGEWECGYDSWKSLYAAVLELIDQHPLAAWPRSQVEAVLYAMARDNDIQHLAREVRRRQPTTLLGLAAAAAQVGERDAKWQLAEELGHLPPGNPEVERILLDLASDEDEYVRRRALQALARIGSPAVEALARREWHRPHEDQQWTRMAVLWSLDHVGSPLLPGMLAETENDPRTYLRDFAKGLRQGQAGP